MRMLSARGILQCFLVAARRWFPFLARSVHSMELLFAWTKMRPHVAQCEWRSAGHCDLCDELIDQTCEYDWGESECAAQGCDWRDPWCEQSCNQWVRVSYDVNNANEAACDTHSGCTWRGCLNIPGAVVATRRVRSGFNAAAEEDEAQQDEHGEPRADASHNGADGRGRGRRRGGEVGLRRRGGRRRRGR